VYKTICGKSKNQQKLVNNTVISSALICMASSMQADVICCIIYYQIRHPFKGEGCHGSKMSEETLTVLNI
jgi:hypothetical protein